MRSATFSATNCTFRENWSLSRGAAVFDRMSSSIRLMSCRFVDHNKAESAEGSTVEGGQPPPGRGLLLRRERGHVRERGHRGEGVGLPPEPWGEHRPLLPVGGDGRGLHVRRECGRRGWPRPCSSRTVEHSIASS